MLRPEHSTIERPVPAVRIVASFRGELPTQVSARRLGTGLGDQRADVVSRAPRGRWGGPGAARPSGRDGR
ncbi:hypothetical protein [Lentzea sp. HUAS12]|uniref:hypothetical protein n=1 Tax=Lentzea sp. HUAS12 TaxID=2951806 RepID=UPI0020A13692|nr:hypothetical protein [Lentzea sp. HUAS12]USX48896.1 hypothetical protein ND450_25940 [Lentzea sp. HUAS12]